ncbi:MAG: undecaprenyl-diphosphate phosphatase [Cocleimonas sp.]|nr:undecaprenyl-diphosphate phosphatase [Cocleimonas sp.]
MDSIDAIILGIIQGLTEFLPVSSSGHLEIAKFILGENTLPQDSMLMTVVLHGATALSTIVIFRKDILELLKGIFQFEWNEESKFALKIIISMVPAAFVGVFFSEEIAQLFSKNLILVGSMLLVTGVLLLLADKAKRTEKNVSFKSAIIIGISQAIAILPGISRSGATISTAVLLGIDREKAARFSFLMVVPLILGKMSKDALSGDLAVSSSSITPLALGFIAAFITGLFACTWMIALVKKSKLSWFAIYCFIVGIATLLYAGYPLLN